MLKRSDQVLEHLRWPFVWIAYGVLALLGLILCLRSCSRFGTHLAETAKNFKEGTITQTFSSSLPQIFRQPGGNLELAAFQVVEVLSRSNSTRVLWSSLYLGTTVSEIKVPVTYRYHIQLNDSWNITVSSNTCVVYAPKIRAALPPAIHTEGMEKRSSGGWAKFDARAELAELERSLTPTLEGYAGDERHLTLIVEQCRMTIAEFAPCSF